MSRRSYLFPLLGLSFIVAGADKLLGNQSYERLFKHLDFSEDEMRLVATGEVAGGVLVALPPTRRLGGAVLAATSAVVLTRELQRQDSRLALPRFGLMVAALAALVLPRR